MYKFLKTVGILIPLFLFNTLFAQSPEQFIPKDATFVFTWNPKQLNSKVNLLELGRYEFYDMMMGQMSAMTSGTGGVMTKLLLEPSSIGLDYLQQYHFFGKFTDKGDYFGLTFQLKDSEQFRKFLMEDSGFEGDMEVSEVNGFNFVVPENNMIISWKGNTVLIGGGETELIIDEDNEESVAWGEAKKRAASLDWVKRNQQREYSESIISNSRFMEASQKQDDAHLWIDYSVIMDAANNESLNTEQVFGGDITSLLGMELGVNMMKSLFDGTFMSVGLNFDAGKIAVDLRQFMNQESMNTWKTALDGGKLNKKFIKYLKGDQLLGYWNINLDTEKVMEAYKSFAYDLVEDLPGYGDIASKGLDVLGIFIDDDAIANLFTGDVLLAVTGMQSVKKTITTTEYDEDFNTTDVQKEVIDEVPEATLMLSYGNEEDVMKLIRLGESAAVLNKMGDYYKLSVPGFDFEFRVALKKGVLFITNSNDLINNRLDKGYPKKNRISKSHCKGLKENCQVLYWDIPNTMAALKLEEMAEPLGAGEFVNMGKQSFESIMITSSKEVNNSFDSQFSINFVNKEKNSLKQLFDLIDEIYAAFFGGGGRT